jgi:hypothetical protein
LPSLRRWPSPSERRFYGAALPLPSITSMRQRTSGLVIATASASTLTAVSRHISIWLAANRTAPSERWRGARLQPTSVGSVSTPACPRVAPCLVRLHAPRGGRRRVVQLALGFPVGR